MGVKQSPTIRTLPENTEAIEFANARPAKSFSRRKYIDIRHNYVVSVVEGGQVVLKLVPTDQMLAYFLTKPLGQTALTSTIERHKLFGVAHKMTNN